MWWDNIVIILKSKVTGNSFIIVHLFVITSVLVWDQGGHVWCWFIGRYNRMLLSVWDGYFLLVTGNLSTSSYNGMQYMSWIELILKLRSIIVPLNIIDGVRVGLIELDILLIIYCTAVRNYYVVCWVLYISYLMELTLFGYLLFEHIAFIVAQFVCTAQPCCWK